MDAKNMKKPKFRKKYLISLVILVLAVFFNVKEIPIQDNFVALIKIVLYTMFGGFTVKTVKDIVVNKMQG